MKRAIKLLLIYFAYQVICTLPLVFVMALLSISSKNSPTFSPTVIAISLIISSLLMAWHLIHFNYIKLDKKTLSPVSPKVIILTLLMGASAVFILDWLNEGIELPNWAETAFEELKNNPLGIICVGLIAPIVEELLFRGAIEGYLLTKWKNPYWAILISALIFGIIHLNPAQIPFAFLIGILFGWLYYRTGSLLPGIILHVVNNTASLILMNLYPQDATLIDLMGKSSVIWLTVFACFFFVLSTYLLNKTLPVPQKTENDIPKEM